MNTPDSPNTAEAVKTLLTKERECSFGTLADETPLVTATIYLYEPSGDGKIGILYLFLSDLARHTKNIRKSRRVSLLIVEERPEVSLLQRERATVVGEINRVEGESETERLKVEYRKRFPGAEAFLSLPDFHFYQVRPREIHWIGGFGRQETLKVSE